MNKFKNRQFWLVCFFAAVISAALFTGYLDGEIFFKAMVQLLSFSGGEIQDSI